MADDTAPDNQPTETSGQPPNSAPEPTSEPAVTPQASEVPESPQTPETPPTPLGIVTSSSAKRRSRGPFVVLIILILAALAGAAWLVTQRPFDKAKPAATQTKQDIPLLRYGAFEGPINIFYPAIGLVGGEVDVNQQIFEGLVRYDDQTKIVPLLATSWTNPDASTWIFTLKPNVKFHTGRTMTAQDVKASIEFIQENNKDLGGTFAGTITSVEVIDDTHVKIVTDGPDPVLLNKLTFLYVFDTTSGKKEDPVNGTGPYQLKAGTTPSEKEVDLIAFDDYHGGHVYLRELQFLYYEEEAKLADDLKAGKLNMAGPMLQIENIQKVADFAQIKYKNPGVSHIGINTLNTKSPVSKLKVREAIYLATDPEALFKARGVTGEPFGQIVSAEIPGYNPAIKRPARNVAKAKQLLAEAGYPNGINLTIDLVKAAATGQELAKQLKDAGITVKLEEHPDIGPLADKIFSGDIEAYYVSYSSDVLDAIDVFTTFFYKSPVYDNPEVTALIDEANKTTDQAKRLKLLQQVSKIVMDDIAWVPTGIVQGTWAFDKPYVLHRDVATAAFGVYFWQVYTQ